MILHYNIYLNITSYIHMFEVQPYHICIFYTFHLYLFAYGFRSADQIFKTGSKNINTAWHVWFEFVKFTISCHCIRHKSSKPK